MVRIRQLLDQLKFNLLFLPFALVVGVVVLSQLTLLLDRTVFVDPPDTIRMSVDSARSILTALASGLISTVGLLLSLRLVVVQLASSQFSPRTSRDWLNDRRQQLAIAIVLGAAVFPLLILRETRDLADTDPIIPHISVLAALVGGFIALLVVVRSVGLLGKSVRLGTVAARISGETTALIHSREEDRTSLEASALVPAIDPAMKIDPEAMQPIESRSSGWIQQVDYRTMLEQLSRGSVLHVVVSPGDFIMTGQPLAWVASPTRIGTDHTLAESVAVGENRTMQEDIGFGLMRLVDIALRALSPGVNDPNTACDAIEHIGAVVLTIWENPLSQERLEIDGRTLVRSVDTYELHIAAVFGPLRRYGGGDVEVNRTLLRVLRGIRAEVGRRQLPGPTSAIDAEIQRVLAGVERQGFVQDDVTYLREM